MTPAGELLRAEITSLGPVTFHRFMEVALYDPEHGYYRKRRDPFGKDGDFFTAEQVQPVFGILIRSLVRELMADLDGEAATVVELGAGREEMRESFGDWRYVAVEPGGGEVPDRFQGVAFANEFFDALPVHAIVRRGAELLERLVGWNGEQFVWVDGGAAGPELRDYLDRFGAPLEDGGLIEVNLDSRQALAHLGRRMERGWLLAIDYGYTSRELVRFPGGTLMSYRRHQALPDVLSAPGERDITAHVNFTALSAHLEETGFVVARFESMAQTLLRAGERDQFASVLAASSDAEALRRRMQLKTLLYGMGETFRVLLGRKLGRK